MAIKTKVTKEAATKAELSVPAPEKKGAAKSLITPAIPKKPTPVEVPKSTKSVSKPNPQPLTAIPKAAPEIAPEPAEITAKKTSPKVEAAVKQAVPQTPSVVPQDLRWQEIRLILEKLKDDTIREIRKSVKSGTEAVAAIEPGGDIYDQASSERDRELGLLLGDREREKIHSIDEALLRIDEGDYGICEECDEDIPLGRLKAMPFTRHCVKCKSDLEKLQAQTKRVEEERAYREIPLGAEDEES